MSGPPAGVAGDIADGAFADYLIIVPLEAGNLHDALHHRRWRPLAEEVPAIALQLAKACAHVHSKGKVRINDATNGCTA